MYHKIRYGEKNQETKKNKPKGGKFNMMFIGWEEDDKDYSIKQSGSNTSNSIYQRPSFGKTELNLEKSNTNLNSNYSFKPPTNEVTAKATISLEQKLIEDLLKPTGIIIRPSENQLKEFAKRVKSLDQEIIFEMLYQKLSNYENMSDLNESKIIMKCLHILEYIAQNKIEPLNQAFAERQEIIENIRDNFNNNKKLVDIANSVINLYNPQQDKNSKPVNLIIEETPVKKFDLLNLNSQNDNKEISKPNLIDLDFGSNLESKPKNPNMLDNIFEGRDSKTLDNKSMNDNQKSFKFLKKTNKTETNETQNIFSGLANQNTGNATNHIEPAPKKNFAFIKKEKDKTNTNNLQNILNFQENEPAVVSNAKQVNQGYQAPNFDIFDSFPISNNTTQQEIFNKNIINSLADAVPIVDISQNLQKQSNTKTFSSNIDDIFDVQNLKINNLPTYTNGANPSLIQKSLNNKNVDLNSANNFNYNHLGNHVEIYKSNSKENDAFGFVSDMLKSKKN